MYDRNGVRGLLQFWRGRQKRQRSILESFYAFWKCKDGNVHIDLGDRGMKLKENILSLRNCLWMGGRRRYRTGLL